MASLKQKHMDLLRSGVESLRFDTDFCDVDIKINQKTFRCHRAILASVSPYFRAMFTVGMKESHERHITLQDVDEIAFERFLQFVYTGSGEGIREDAAEVVRIADQFQVGCLQDYCEDMLIEQLRVDNSLQLHRLAELYNCPRLLSLAWPAVLDGFCSIWKLDDYDNLTLEEVVRIIKDDSLVTYDEEHVCEAALKWINADLTKRAQQAYEIFRHIRLPHLSPDYLVTRLCQQSCLMENADCRMLLQEAQQFHLLPARKLDFSNERMRYRADDDFEEVILVITENDDEHGSFYEGGWCLWAFSFQQNRWFTLSPIPLSNSPGLHFAICAHRFDIYLSGGTNNAKALIKFENERNDWTTGLGQMKKGRCQHCMVSVGNSLYSLGGNNFKMPKANQVMGSIEEFYIPAQRWHTVGELNQPVHSATAAVRGEQIFVFGGVGKDDKATRCVQCFHTRLKESTVISNLPFLPNKLTTVTIGNTIYITSLSKDENYAMIMTDDNGFEDVGFDLPSDCSLLGIVHHNGNFLLLTERSGGAGHLERILEVDVNTSENKLLHMKGNTLLKQVHACHRSYVDKRFLYHTFFQ